MRKFCKGCPQKIPKSMETHWSAHLPPKKTQKGLVLKTFKTLKPGQDWNQDSARLSLGFLYIVCLCYASYPDLVFGLETSISIFCFSMWFPSSNETSLKRGDTRYVLLPAKALDERGRVLTKTEKRMAISFSFRSSFSVLPSVSSGYSLL